MTRFSYLIHALLINIIRIVINFIPKKKGFILFSAWFGEKYADNSRYTFEYMLRQGKYSVKWYTINKALYEELNQRKIPVVYGRSICGIWQQIRAQALVSAVQFSDFNNYFIGKCKYIDLDHGFSLKQVGLAIPGTGKYNIKYEMLLRKGVEYWMSASTQFCMEKIRECYWVSDSQIIKCNKPRTDVLFDINLKSGKNQIVDEIKDGRKAIVWMPTHRNCGDVPLPVSEIFDLQQLNEVCKKNDIVFFIKKHFYHNKEREELSQFSNIIDITAENIDAQVILSQADALVSDYSSSYIEYLILDRPIILYAFDKESFLKFDRDLYIPLEENTAGEVVYTKEKFISSIQRISNDWYDTSFVDGRHKARDLYFDNTVEPGTYREKAANIIEQVLNDRYSPTWSK